MRCYNTIHTAIFDDDVSMLANITKTIQCDFCIDCKRSLLCSAVRHGSQNIVEFLLNANCDVNIRDEDYELNALAICIEKRFFELAVSLIKYNIDINVINSYGLTLFGVAVADKHNSNFIDLLIENGGDISVCDVSDISVLQRAIYYGSTEMVAQVLKYDQNIDLVNKHDQTALGISLICGYDELASILIGNGANVNLTNKDGFSYLHTVVKYNYTKTPRLIYLLLENGCHINHCNKFNISPLALTLEVDRLFNRKNDETIKVLIKYGARLVHPKLNILHANFLKKDLIMFLYLNGVPFDASLYQSLKIANNVEIESLINIFNTPMSLFYLTRLFLRKYLLDKNEKKTLPSMLRKLPIPPLLLNSLDIEVNVL